MSSSPGWTQSGVQLDDSGRNRLEQAVCGRNCNVSVRLFAAVLALFALWNIHLGSARAAGETVPTDMSAQIDGMVSTALAAAQSQDQPAAAQSTAESLVGQALALAKRATAQATSAAATPLAPQSADVVPPVSTAAPSSRATAAAHAAPPRAHHARVKKRARPAPVRATPRVLTVLPPSPTFQGSPSTARPSPNRAARPAKASPRPGRAAPPERPRIPVPWPMPPRPDASSSGQAGGGFAPVPLLLAALVGVLIVFGLVFGPRLLPLLAFRKPRRIVLPSWHPG
jgi:hypothetical protein